MQGPEKMAIHELHAENVEKEEMIIMYDQHKGINTSVFHENTLTQSPTTCASSSGENSTFPATIWQTQEHKI